MAFKIIRSETDKYQQGEEITAVCDADSDLTALGTDFAPGSVAIIPGAGVKMLNASGEWVDM